MIEFKSGDLFQSNADALVNAVNCVGVMGKGIALQFKRRYPHMYDSYRIAAESGNIVPGRMHVFHMPTIIPPRYIINFPTKRHWKDMSVLSDIDSGITDLVDKVKNLGIKSIAIPKLGAGNGGLDWFDVRSLLVSAFEKLPDVKVIIYE